MSKTQTYNYDSAARLVHIGVSTRPVSKLPGHRRRTESVLRPENARKTPNRTQSQKVMCLPDNTLQDALENKKRGGNELRTQ